MPVWAQIILAVIGAGGASGLAVFFTIRAQNEKTCADADKVSAEAWSILIKSQAEELVRLRMRIEALEGNEAAKDARINDLEDEVDDLRAWIEHQGLTPPPRKRKDRV